jgi:outer membrane protein OmpU
MRKLLLATTAMLGGLGLVGTASAQVKLNNGTTVTTPFTAGGGLGALQPQPGNIVVHLDGRVAFTAGAYFDQSFNRNTTTPSSIISFGSPVSGSLLPGPATGQQKVNTIDFGTTLRLQPGFDGVAANGLQYGGYAEIRFDQDNAQVFSEGSPGNFGAAFGGATGTPSQEQRTRDTAYLYQSWGYVGTPQLGIIRGGMLFSSSSMLLTGTMENFDDGGWHGGSTLQAIGGMPWPFIDNGGMNGVNSLQYLSPQIFGFDGSITFQPNSGGGDVWSGCATGGGTGIVGIGCDRLSTSTDPSQWTRRTNTLDMALRYRGTFGPVGIATSGGFITSGRVLPGAPTVTQFTTTVGTTGVLSTTSSVLNTSAPFVASKNLSIGLAGAQVSYGGLLVGGHVEWGAFGYQEALEMAGAARQVSWVAGATYTLGAATFGLQWFNYHSSAGQANANVGARNQQGPWLGAQYVLAPGLLTYVGYGYTNDFQRGFNWANGAPNTGAIGSAAYNTSNAMHTQQVVIGSIFSW